jgi:cell fate regulator YaaT (PSP1 superfamily)
MPQVVGVRFKPVTKVYYFDPNGTVDLELDDRVIVETARGIEMGVVALPPQEVPASEIKSKLKRVIRKATPLDLIEAATYQAQEEDALKKCRELATELNIPMKVLEAEYSFDGKRLLYAFTAEQRVDFRDLVKELTGVFKTRIEMKQVGARDETKILDGYGRCGRRLCCSSWLTEFHSVSIKMAKQQNLPLAPSEISGLCGRLLCCLAYEDEMYAAIKSTMPKVNTQVKTKQGVIATVRGLNIIKETVLLEVDDGENYIELDAAELEPMANQKQAKEEQSKDKNKKK